MPRQPRQLWTQEEDNDLKRLRRENPKYSWEEIIKQGNLKGRTPKSCSHRWHNYLKSDFNGGEFSPEEDEQIINLKRRRVSWASMPEEPLLKHRSPNDIKNRWYSRLKKGTATVSDPRRPLPYHVQQPLMNDQTTDHSLSEDGIKARVSSLFTDDDIEAWVSSLFTDDHQNPISSIPQHSHSLSEDDSEAWVSSLFTDDDIEAWVSSLFTDDHQNPISLIPQHSHSLSEDDSEAWVSSLFTDDDIEAWVSSLFTDNHQNAISSIPQHSHSLSEDDIEAWVSSLFTDDDQNPISSIPDHSS